MPHRVVFLDESFKDETALCCGVVIDLDDVELLEEDIADLRQAILRTYSLEGMKSFEAFKRNSFHATEDSWEIRDEFYRFLSSRLDVRIYIEYCSAIDLSISVNQAHLGLYYDLLGNIMRKPARYSVIFEQNAALEPFLENLAARAVPSKYRSRGLVRYSISSKQENSCLAVADYAMWAFAEWKRENFTTDPQKKQFRTWKSIQRLVSVARERQGKTIRRQLPVAPMIHSR